MSEKRFDFPDLAREIVLAGLSHDRHDLGAVFQPD